MKSQALPSGSVVLRGYMNIMIVRYDIVAIFMSALAKKRHLTTPCKVIGLVKDTIRNIGTQGLVRLHHKHRIHLDEANSLADKMFPRMASQVPLDSLQCFSQ